jgi:hypothetical protein
MDQTAPEASVERALADLAVNRDDVLAWRPATTPQGPPTGLALARTPDAAALLFRKSSLKTPESAPGPLVDSALPRAHAVAGA